MQKRKLDNKTLDIIGRGLIESDASRSNDIEKVISNPHLFALVNAKIAAIGKTPSVTTSSGLLALSFVGRNALAFAGVALILISVIGVASLLRSEKALFAAKELQVSEAIPDTARPEVPPQPFVGKLSAGRAFDRKIEVAKREAKPVSKRVDRRPQTHVGHEPEGEFYALSFAGDPDETVGGGRIIRVDVPRSSLFALGVNVPLENGPEVVKADLLIGSDGMTRGIRVVK